ncbi:PilN domain-containing protein [Actinotalea fermentans]|uniref:Fimbrial assembly protein n=1 Tax=Actinotalea fermentans TaxID=43671 RepID=A0A511YUI3_9CELL|nr:hypothetical protein [Actinotalea fermentans]KGM17044.1 hypothetical protein N867_10910 [Actinotalea fermentans ATCC 43279 = JCM 9966 = DSM 3133]GEN78855.1 hypothetical protein AFE02nite_05890 [Actinotalea fermentans]
MSTTTDAPASKGRARLSGRAPALGAPPYPQVNLLPPEVAAARGLARTKRWLALFVALSLVGLAGLYLLGVRAKDAAADDLAAAQQTTQDLNAQKEQYAEVPLVLAELDRAAQARQLSMQTEILWRPYLRALAATAPEGVRIETVRLFGTTVIDPPVPPPDVLGGEGVGTVSLTVESRTVPDTAAWLRALETIPGFEHAWFSQHTLTAENDVAYYSVTATVQINEAAFALRYEPEVEGDE